MKKEVIVKTTREKTYTFDRVFGSESDQEMVYEGVANGLLREMLQGYNCTVFAYGQTGTGKTHTMSGDIEMKENRLPENAGIIPRTLVDLFRSLEKNPEFTVKVSFIELYNEELRDLLLTRESEDRKVRIFDDPEKKSIVVQGMEEVFIRNANEGMEILKKGSYNRQVAATKCNDLSSRSHSVFTVTVHMKEVDPISGEEYLKVGKLNLVDLAGSENISRSGAENKRAREAGMINQSLLTLGRVINALVDQSPHIPYRESKLTRLLQDSLGGRTKTCIIATISPAKVSLDETISTLEYANRAKNIKNKPQLNQTMSKKMLIKEYIREIERLRNDLNATRNKNGVYVSDDNWEKINSESENKRMQVEDQKLRIDVLEEKIRNYKRDFEGQMEQIRAFEEQVEKAKEEKRMACKKLESSMVMLQSLERDLKIEALMNQNLKQTESQLIQAHGSLTSTLSEVIQIRDSLHSSIEKKSQLESKNLEVLDQAKKHIVAETNVLAVNSCRLYDDNTLLASALNEGFQLVIDAQQSKIHKKCNDITTLGENLLNQTRSSLETLLSHTNSVSSSVNGAKIINAEVRDSVIGEVSELRKGIMNMARDINIKIEDIKDVLTTNSCSLKEQVGNDFALFSTKLREQDNKLNDVIYSFSQKHQQAVAQFEKEIEKLRAWKESEDDVREDEQVQLLQQISSLIQKHESKRQRRFDEGLSSITPALSNAVRDHSQVIDGFKSFIDGDWVSMREDFISQIDQRSSSLAHHIQEKMKLELKPVSDSLFDISRRQCSSIESLIKELNAKTGALAQYITNVNQLVEEGHELTNQEFKKFNSQTQDALQKIQSSFLKYGKALADSKPRLVDTFVSKQESFMKSYKDATLENIRNLSDYVQKIEYEKDSEDVPTKQEISFPKNLPRSLPRNEVIRIHQNELDPMEKKVPLSEIAANSNLSGDMPHLKCRPVSNLSLNEEN
jgi:kinesin family protein 11